MTPKNGVILNLKFSLQLWSSTKFLKLTVYKSNAKPYMWAEKLINSNYQVSVIAKCIPFWRFWSFRYDFFNFVCIADRVPEVSGKRQATSPKRQTLITHINLSDFDHSHKSVGLVIQ